MSATKIVVIVLGLLVVVLFATPFIRLGRSPMICYRTASESATRLANELNHNRQDLYDVRPVLVPVNAFRKEASIIVSRNPNITNDSTFSESYIRNACQRIPALVFMGNGSNWEAMSSSDKIAVWVK
jgi:hypothetical protein